MGVITGDWERAFNGLGDIVKGVFDQIVNVARSSFNMIIGPLNAMLDTYNRANDVFGGPDIGPIKGFASGVTNFQGGLAYVHQGEVLTNLPRGTNVVTKTAANKMEPGGQRAITVVIEAANSMIISTDQSWDDIVRNKIKPALKRVEI